MSSPSKGSRPTHAGGRGTTPNGAKSSVSRPLTAKTTTTTSKSATVSRPVTTRDAIARRAPITASTRQARLAMQEQRRNTQRTITGIFLAILVAVAALIVWNVVPKPVPAAIKPKACLTPPKGQPTNGAAPPVVTTKPTVLAGNLQYIDMVVGCGDAIPDGTATITANYTGWVQGGAKFDSSVDRGQPAQFALTGVIKGWTQGLVGMKIGGVRRLIIPGDLAYGANPPTGSNIPPNATLIFDVSLVSIP
jgi:hypothetical protein